MVGEAFESCSELVFTRREVIDDSVDDLVRHINAELE